MSSRSRRFGGSPITGTGAVTVVGADGVHQMLQDYTDPKLRKRLQRAMSAGAKVAVPPLRAESRTVSKRMGRAVTSKQTPKGLSGESKMRDPAGEPNAFVGYRRKTAFFAHMVIGGTKAHGPRSARILAWQGANGPIFANRVRGVRPNPIVSRVADANAARIYEAVNRSLDTTETK